MLPDCMTEDGRAYEIPRELFHLMVKCNETQGHLRDWLDYWEQADELMQPMPDIGEKADGVGSFPWDRSYLWAHEVIRSHRTPKTE